MEDDELVGVGGCDTCIGVVVVDEDNGMIYCFHFGAGDDPHATLAQYDFGDNAQAFVCGGNEEPGSTRTLGDAFEALERQSVDTHYSESNGIWVDHDRNPHAFEDDYYGRVKVENDEPPDDEPPLFHFFR